MDHINGSLSPEFDVADAGALRVNTRPQRCFQGQTPGHTAGFVLTAAQRQQLIQSDPASEEVIHPFMAGHELNSRGLPGRFVIDIPADDLVSALRWPGALAHVREHVLPTRQERAENERERNEEALRENPRARVNWHHRRFYEF